MGDFTSRVGSWGGEDGCCCCGHPFFSQCLRTSRLPFPNSRPPVQHVQDAALCALARPVNTVSLPGLGANCWGFFKCPPCFPALHLPDRIPPPPPPLTQRACEGSPSLGRRDAGRLQKLSARVCFSYRPPSLAAAQRRRDVAGCSGAKVVT